MFKQMKKKILLALSLILLAGCSLPGLGGNLTGQTITVTSGGSTEMQIMGYIVQGMIEHYIDTDVNIVSNLGSSTMNHQALMGGDANVSAVRYTGTSLTGELGQDPITDPDLAFKTVVKGFDEAFDQKWYPSYGFANTYAFMVTRENAEKYGLEKVSDLEQYADSIDVGVDSSWISRAGDGYAAFQETYGFGLPNLYPMSIGLVYTAVANDEVDVVLGYSTDGRIISEDLVVLEDDRHLFPPYDGSAVANHEILAEYPELDNILMKLEGTISDEDMQRLNYTSDEYLLEPKTVATKFLEENNYFEDKEPYVEPVEKGVLE
ncbi:osmoprotectant ABC transporter substrate-binding protein [Aerococcus kribbianus]|uniref:Osmoprotectant ABC transporter substrate-binding protein n=1 Tax=Aerococcus kribbianus TaxID=2999064 RepID=A0A9X3FQ13_9LACT|nr:MULTISPECIES: osmoprotectant ABC transporter substrate-binding protein [unclassified Aerococcus]MCZ0717879.1 osmoprotectant ABC transporter substrate-binding protein [Aerococcus sp. YH-aer221]MCZ0726166.1 osmoprotectant ABC transporter substrate-binding protein [Aerococcus sp. YH-aer222]